MAYDSSNIFARILAGEIPCKPVFEDEHVLAFNDIHPQAPVHVLVIPKGAYVSLSDFATKAAPIEQTAFFAAVGKIVADLGLDAQGYRVIANAGANGGQEVPHFHLHILGGRNLGRMLARVED
ncbi:MAG: histidine triad nucleotide-binding protein [Rhodospirillales bacterium]|nr:histidine triad nucleotide-binding protein [Alphaproteobacteria bacterium]MCB9986599.1 histidine triad nucleotide-binding protein [Rhodospirillales bacterium]USO06871.1 MAG: histidine triad nucleotide-binding protein [Rhodospirillales bacterium]